MFNDFKVLNYNTTNNKIRKIKELLDRLDLATDELETRYFDLNNTYNGLDRLVQELKPFLDEVKRRQEEPTPEPTNLPDLLIDSIIPTLYSNYINLEITIKNQGSVASSATTLNTVIPSLRNYSNPIPALEPEETFITNIQYSFDPAGTDENKEGVSTVNPNHSFDELNFNNNTQDFLMEVKSPYSGAGVIVHLHNPEGKEINSIQGMIGNEAKVTIGGYNYTGAKNLAEHGQKQSLYGMTGLQTCVATFNGITLTSQINIPVGETIELIFTFERIDSSLDVTFFQSASGMALNNQIITISTFPWVVRVSAQDSSYGIGNINLSASLSSFILNLSTNKPNLSGLSTIVWYGDFTYSPNPLYTDINLALQTNFTDWIVQSIPSGYFPGFRLLSLEPIYAWYQLPTWRKPDFPLPISRLIKLSAGRNYIGLQSWLSDIQVSAFSGETSKNLILTGTNQFKMSSVPYDLNGTAV